VIEAPQLQGVAGLFPADISPGGALEAMDECWICVNKVPGPDGASWLWKSRSSFFIRQLQTAPAKA
jgi:hypothetical protein